MRCLQKLHLSYLQILLRSFNSAIGVDAKLKDIDGISICYSDDNFYAFLQTTLNLLRDEAPSYYSRVKQRVKSIVQIGNQHTWNRGKSAAIWAPIGKTYFDEFTQPQRLELGPKRYAAILVRLAATIRIIDEFRIYAAWNPQWPSFMRATKIALKQELLCCQDLNCETKWIYAIQRLLRRDN
jgi:hypothetical protein